MTQSVNSKLTQLLNSAVVNWQIQWKMLGNPKNQTPFWLKFNNVFFTPFFLNMY